MLKIWKSDLWSCKGVQAKCFGGKKKRNKILEFLFFDIFQDCKFLETSTKMFHLQIKLWLWIKGMYMSHVKKISKKELNWMSNEWSKLTIQLVNLQAKFREKYYFHFFEGKQKIQTIWNCDEKWHSIILFNFCFPNVENIEQQNLSLTFTF
jgi:hypothetical protein